MSFNQVGTVVQCQNYAAKRLGVVGGASNQLVGFIIFSCYVHDQAQIVTLSQFSLRPDSQNCKLIWSTGTTTFCRLFQVAKVCCEPMTSLMHIIQSPCPCMGKPPCILSGHFHVVAMELVGEEISWRRNEPDALLSLRMLHSIFAESRWSVMTLDRILCFGP